MSNLRVFSILLICLALVAGLGVAGCPSDAPSEAAPDPVQWHMPPGTSRVPLVLLLEETGIAGWTGPSPWIAWFLDQGIAVAQISSPPGASRQDWLNGGCPADAGADLRLALELAQRSQPRIDTMHFAILGAGRRGTEALTSAAAFTAETGRPAAVFALYPGCADRCPIDYAAEGPTRVQIFYGTDDDWGLQRGAYRRCRAQAGGQITFHSMPNAGHGFDERYRFTETTDQLLLRHQPHALATAIARSTVLETLTLAWQIDN